MALDLGMPGVDDLNAQVAAGDIDTVNVEFTDHYGRLHGKRFDASSLVSGVIESGTHGCDYLLTVDMEMESVPDYSYANWQLGYGDFHMISDMSTARVAAWLPITTLVLCDLVGDAAHDLVAVAPRTILGRQVQRLEALGHQAKAASELEFDL
jgi:glutamine synthetase